MPSSTRGKLLAAVAALAIAGAACSSAATDPAPPAADGAAAAGELPGRLDLPTTDLEGFQAILANLEGTPVLVNIWASWCGPCRVEAPHLAELATELEGEVQFLGVDILDDRDAAKDFILEFDWQYPSVFDPDGEIRDRLGFIGQPVTFIVDRAGEVVWTWNGAVTADLLREELLRVV